MKDAELIPSPGHSGPDPGPQAWLQLTAQLGELGRNVGQLVTGSRADRRRALALRHVAMSSAVAPASGVVVVDVGGPAAGREWGVRRLHAYIAGNPSGATAGGTATAVSGTFTAASAGNVTLPAGATMTGFDVSMIPAGAAVQGILTVTGLASGTLSYQLSDSAASAGTALSIRFPGAGLPPASSAATPAVNMPAITGGSAYALTAYGTTAVTGATPGAGAWYLGTPAMYGTTTDQWPVPSLPDYTRVGTDQIIVTGRDHLFAAISGVTPGATVIARAFVLDYPVLTDTLVTPL